MNAATAFNWIKPPWRDVPHDSDGGWPWVGDTFLAAVPCVHRESGKEYWDFCVLAWDESGLLNSDGESWSAWSESDIEWIARIPEPKE